ncbi:MAG: DUF2147 domain-containing protein [Candidatus Cryptobacteroides sp.]
MKKIITTILAFCSFACLMNAQSEKNSRPDAIVGSYISEYADQTYKVKVTKNSDGTYKAQNYWLKNPNGKDGKPLMDVKNPDKSLRNIPYSQVVLIENLKYNAEKKQWDNAKIYDPSRGIKANVYAYFMPDGKLMLKGSVLGIGEKIYWTPIEEDE